MVGVGDGEPIEYAVKMYQFDPAQTLNQIHDREGFNHDRLESLCQAVFELHSKAPVSGIEMPFGEPNSLYVPASVNFDQVRIFKSQMPKISLSCYSWRRGLTNI